MLLCMYVCMDVGMHVRSSTVSLIVSPSNYSHRFVHRAFSDGSCVHGSPSISTLRFVHYPQHLRALPIRSVSRARIPRITYKPLISSGRALEIQPHHPQNLRFARYPRNLGTVCTTVCTRFVHRAFSRGSCVDGNPSTSTLRFARYA